MTPFAFKAEKLPFPRWMGPYSPSRGAKSGMRVRENKLGAWRQSNFEAEFCPAIPTPGVGDLVNLVRAHWGGGRILLLPTGHIVKPLQDEEEVGQRVLIGQFRGGLVLSRSGTSGFSLEEPGLKPGAIWTGPSMLGLETSLDASTGELTCEWKHPSALGQDIVRAKVRKPDATLAAGFRVCRPADSNGRVRVTANGHVTTMVQRPNGDWVCHYVGVADRITWPNWDHYSKR